MLALAQSDSANRSPSSTCANVWGLRRPTRSVRKDLSIVITCDTFTTEGFDNPTPLVGSRTFPGAWASRRFDVITAAITVLIRLSLKLLAEITRYGLRKPGPDPEGSGTEAHQISPLRTTTSLVVGTGSAAGRPRARVKMVPLQGHRLRSTER
jgi:hypothetical protein